jgi:hypothetical protein
MVSKIAMKMIVGIEKHWNALARARVSFRNNVTRKDGIKEEVPCCRHGGERIFLGLLNETRFDFEVNHPGLPVTIQNLLRQGLAFSSTARAQIISQRPTNKKTP